ncbi:hypothetical protein AB0O74_35615 [Streptomyces rubiginosohelvolus]|uniref:hypothetical protein n=1 Tax=Streptomyces rubiginosohelvolus TaxID=67362 RepID=UPI00343D48CF
MTTPAAPLGEPLSEALSEAAQAAAMSVRLILTIADAVRRAAQKHHQGEEKELGPDAEELAEGWSAEQLRTVLPEGILNGLMAGADWPLMARHLASLQQAGVDLGVFLPNLGRMASAVDQAVAAATARTSPRAQAPAPSPTAPTPVPAPAVQTAPAPATTPAAAPAPAVRPEPAARPTSTPKAKPDPWAARPVPPVSTDAKRAWGPLTEGLKIPRDLDLADRAHALDQLGISTGAHRLLVSRVNEALPERDAALLVSSRPWPLLAHRMHTMAQAGEPLTAQLARLNPDTAAWRTGPPADTATRLLLAAHHALTTPLEAPLPTGPRVSAPAARSRSTTTGPDTTAHQQPAPAEPAARAHHRQTAPTPRQGRGR